MKRRTFDSNFKKMIVDLFNNGTSVSQLEIEYGLTNSLIYKWIKLYNKDSAKPDASTTEVVKLKRHIKDLEKQLKDKEMEVDILKKASAIFIQTNDKK